MREALFIKKNKDRWLKQQQGQSEDPDEVASDFVQLLDDLAYAKTFYPSGKVTSYINTQASKHFLEIYKNRKEESNRIVRFWKYELPLTIRKHYKICLFSFFLFVSFIVIGYFISSLNPDAARNFFGEAYVEKTIRNIENKNPFGIYEGGSLFLNWFGLMINNLKVDILSYVTGIFFGAPPIYINANNSVMLGIFYQFFSERSFGLDFWLVVFVHGTLEMIAMVFCVAAGIIMGASILFPRTQKRIDSFKQGAKDGLKILIGMLPVTGLAAFFEAFVTRLYNNASWITTSVFILSVVFVVCYFVIWPIILGRRAAKFINEEEE